MPDNNDRGHPVKRLVAVYFQELRCFLTRTMYKPIQCVAFALSGHCFWA